MAYSSKERAKAVVVMLGRDKAASMLGVTPRTLSQAINSPGKHPERIASIIELGTMVQREWAIGLDAIMFAHLTARAVLEERTIAGAHNIAERAKARLDETFLPRLKDLTHA